jgi:hypothetical protein
MTNGFYNGDMSLEKMDRLGDALTERSVEILLDTGWLILSVGHTAADSRPDIAPS